MSGEKEFRGSKDLRAEIGKFPNSTNERKYMSTKTMKQRIAVLAATALGFGVLSATPAFAVALVANDVNISSTTFDAICTVDAAAEIAYVPLNSAGVTILANAAAVADNTTAFWTISGPAVWTAVVPGTDGAGTISVGQKEFSLTDSGTVDDAGATLKPTGVGAVSITVSATSGGVAIDTLTVNVVATCGNAAWSATDSLVQMSATAAGNATSNVDVDTSTTAGTPMYIKLAPEDAYGIAITTGTLYASATNGALLSWGAAAAGFPAGTGSVATGTPTANHQLRVDPAQSATTSTTVVTITLNGTAVATKNITFHGEQAKIVVGTVYSGKTTDADDGTVLFTYQDTAGNTVPGSAAAIVAASAGTRITTAASVKAPTTTSDAIAAVNDVIEAKLGAKTAAGVMTYACGSSAGTADFTIATVSTVNANTLTATVKGMCYGSISTYTVSTDKAAYKIGEVAVITIEAKDSSGNPTADSSKLQASSVSVGGGALTYTLLGTDAAGAVEGFQGGKVTLRAQMTTAGTFNTVVSLTGTATASALTGYSVSSSSTSVTNEEVLKSIVALIASINKQIQALQKLILKR